MLGDQAAQGGDILLGHDASLGLVAPLVNTPPGNPTKARRTIGKSRRTTGKQWRVAAKLPFGELVKERSRSPNAHECLFALFPGAFW